MTVKEHCEWIRFDYNLIERYVPNNGFKRIFPIDPGCGEITDAGEDMEDIYVKLEKTSQIIWKKLVGMNQKKEVNPNIHEN